MARRTAAERFRQVAFGQPKRYAGAGVLDTGADVLVRMKQKIIFQPIVRSFDAARRRRR